MRFLVFAGRDFYPEGGWLDFAGQSETYEDAVSIALSAFDAKDPKAPKCVWWHVIDTQNNEKVAEGKRRP